MSDEEKFDRLINRVFACFVSLAFVAAVLVCGYVCLLITGCAMPEKKAVVPSAPAALAAKVGDVVVIGTNGHCIIFSNNILHRIVTNCFEPEPKKEYVLRWNYSGSNVVFYVQSTTDPCIPKGKWPLKDIVATTQLSLTLSQKQEFFAVRAFDGKQFSGYATR
jgi:hypothetical protein